MGSLGVLQEIGAPVTLEWTDAAGNTHTDAFALCGWWASPTNFTEACAWITADTAASLMPDYDSENAANLTLGVTLHQPRSLEEQAAEMLSDQGLPEVPFTTNLAYNDARMETAGQQARPVLRARRSGAGVRLFHDLCHCAGDGGAGPGLFRPG